MNTFLQTIAPYVLTAVASVLVGYFTVLQQIKTAEKSAASKDRETAATLEKTRLENASVTQNLWHDDLVECKKECKELHQQIDTVRAECNKEINAANRERFEVAAKLSITETRLEDVEGELSESENQHEILKTEYHALDMKHRTTETKLISMRFILADIRLMKAHVAELEAGNMDVHSDDWLHRLDQRVQRDMKIKEQEN